MNKTEKIEYLVYTTNGDRFGINISCKDIESMIESVKDIATRYKDLSINITPIKVIKQGNKIIETIR